MLNIQSSKTNIYTIHAGLPFVDALADGLNNKIEKTNDQLWDFTILLPTRRAVKTLRDAFLRKSAGKPLLLPRLIPLGNLDTDEQAISGWEEPSLSAGVDIKPAISDLERTLLLTKLVQAFAQKGFSADQAVSLAADLGRLLDQVQTHRLSFKDLQEIVPADYAEHWQITLKFLEIVTKAWPAILDKYGCLDPADRQNKLLERQASIWKTSPPQGYIIAAGSTGSIPATADLLNVVSRLPNGCVVLPGLDQTLSEAELTKLEPTHPQYGMAHLLSKMGARLDEVKIWEARGFEKHQTSRAELINIALRPPSSIEMWQHLELSLNHGFEDVEYVECADLDEETGVVALMMRQTLERKGKTAALITPDRELARRVQSQLHRWNIEIDDSAGQPLSSVPSGIFLSLTAELIIGQFKPVDLLAVCKHPIAACGFFPAKLRELIRRLEVSVLRGSRLEPGIDGLLAVLEDSHIDFREFLERLKKRSKYFSQLSARSDVTFRSILEAHIEFSEYLAASNTETGIERLWAGTTGGILSKFMSELASFSDAIDNLPGLIYPSLLKRLMSFRRVRQQYRTHPRLHIWGLLEARFQQADLLILGGLNEGTWPPEVSADPWMSRPMRKKFGLPLPEHRVGLSAHDFTQAFCAPSVALTRSRRVGGTPTVPARWLLRITQLLDGHNLLSVLCPKHPWKDLQALLDKPKKMESIAPPAPTPPVSARPRQLSVTQVETWMRDPYSIYAKYILKLIPLPALNLALETADYGTLVHQILNRFSETFPARPGEPLPDNAEDILIELGRQKFGAITNFPAVWAFWWPRFLSISKWFIDQERAARPEIVDIKTEVKGQLELVGPHGPFTLVAVADRIDCLESERLRIIDYKTGAPPTQKEISAGFAPQLPLEAAIANSGGFKSILGNNVSALNYWRLKGGTPAGEISSAGENIHKLAKDAIEGLENLIKAFDHEDTPYEARPRPEQAPKYSDYEHLARVKEWIVSDMLSENSEE
ncbi:MAG TPA: double-strand break repair protein AddB [Rhodospirillales bacterium]|nr:double-strand break repair protein AddB [Rhodospirillales bacterium]